MCQKMAQNVSLIGPLLEIKGRFYRFLGVFSKLNAHFFTESVLKSGSFDDEMWL